MIDLHCHLLAGLDDGPVSLAESVQMCRMALDDGITHAITTPHIHPGRWDNTIDLISKELACLRRALADEGLGLQLGFAAEVRLTDDIIRCVQEGAVPFLGERGGYQIMLLEFPHAHIPPGSDKLVAWLLEQGVRPLIAHPERNKQVMKDVSRIYPYVELGCWLQLTAGSLLGLFGEPAGETAMHLLDRDMVTVVATDAHNTGARRPLLRPAYEAIKASHGSDRAQRLVFDNPLAISAEQFANCHEFSSMASIK